MSDETSDLQIKQETIKLIRSQMAKHEVFYAQEPRLTD